MQIPQVVSVYNSFNISNKLFSKTEENFSFSKQNQQIISSLQSTNQAYKSIGVQIAKQLTLIFNNLKMI